MRDVSWCDTHTNTTLYTWGRESPPSPPPLHTPFKSQPHYCLTWILRNFTQTLQIFTAYVLRFISPFTRSSSVSAYCSFCVLQCYHYQSTPTFPQTWRTPEYSSSSDAWGSKTGGSRFDWIGGTGHILSRVTHAVWSQTSLQRNGQRGVGSRSIRFRLVPKLRMGGRRGGCRTPPHTLTEWFLTL